MTEMVGMIGVGVMGQAMSRNLVAAGFQVVGYDPASAALDALAEFGGHRAASAEAVADAAEVVITCLPSASALAEVVRSLSATPRVGRVLAETSTLRLTDKEAARHDLATAGIEMLDCPLSGSANQALLRDVLVYASGDRIAYERCLPAFEAFSRAPHYVGVFGQGMRMKLIANHLVGIHTAAAGEAFALARAANLNPAQVFDLINDGAGGSRALAARKEMLIADEYLPVRTMAMQLWMKDVELIAEFASSLGHDAPLFDAASRLFRAAVAAGRGTEDTAAVGSTRQASPRAAADFEQIRNG